MFTFWYPPLLAQTPLNFLIEQFAFNLYSNFLLIICNLCLNAGAGRHSLTETGWFPISLFGQCVHFPWIHCLKIFRLILNCNLKKTLILADLFENNIIRIGKSSFPRRLILNLTLMKTYWLSTPLSVMRYQDWSNSLLYPFFGLVPLP